MLSSLLGVLLLGGTTTPLWNESYKPITPKQEIHLAKLMDCESSGSSTVKILDSNSEYSVGAYQYQFKTWEEMVKKYGLPFTDKDIYDWRKQKFLTHLILLDGGETHWFNCHKKLGKYPKS